MDTQNAPEVGFKSFAFVELFGHGRIAGFITEEKIAGASFLRVEVPATSRHEAFTRSFGPGAIFAITPLPDEAECQQVAERLNVPRILPTLLCEERSGPPWPLGVGEDDNDSAPDEVEPEDVEDAAVPAPDETESEEAKTAAAYEQWRRLDSFMSPYTPWNDSHAEDNLPDEDFWPDEPEQEGDGREWVDEPPTG